MRSAAVLAALVVALACGQMRFTGNVSESGVDAHLGFRETGVWLTSSSVLAPLALYTVFYSLSADAAASVLQGQALDAAAEARADAIWSYAGVTRGSVPVMLYGFWNGTFQVSLDWKDPATSLDVSGAAGFMATSYVAVVERDSRGAKLSEASLAWGSSGLEWSCSDSGSKGGLSWYKISGRNATGGAFSVAITYIVSDVPGVVELAGTVVAPRVVESVIEMHDYPAASETSSLELVVGAAAVGCHSSGGTSVSSGTGVRVFADLAARATVDGSEQHADVGVWVNASADDAGLAGVAKLLATATGGDVVAMTAVVRFPRGARDIVYDPAAGTGTSPYELTPSSSPSAAVPLGALLLISVVSASLEFR
eukprot:m51a1_g2460 hypothetical protein (367) ;mRNA; r:19695-20964